MNVMKTRGTSRAKILRILTTVILTGLLTTRFLTAQGWYNSNWLYRVPVTINNSNAGDPLTDFQVLVTLNSSFQYWNHIEADGSDIRFTTSDGITAIPYWIESWNDGISSSIWVKIPSLASGISTIYLYYGYIDAPVASSGSATFEFFDDFNQGSLDGSKWNIVGSPSVAFTTDEGSMVLSMLGSNSHDIFITTLDQTFDNFVFETKVKLLADANNACTPEVGFRYTSLNYRYITLLRGATQNDLFVRKYYNGIGYINAAPYYDYVANQFYKYKVTANGNTLGIYLNDALVINPTNAGGDVLTGGFCLHNYGSTNRVYYDDVRVRSFAAADPSASTGTDNEQDRPLPLTIESSKTDAKCYGGSDGAINITVSGGTLPYSYSWTGPLGYISSEEDITGLSAGSYSVHVSAANGGVGDMTISILQPTVIVPEYTITNLPVCANGAATVEITATGGTPPYSGTGIFQQAVGLTNYMIIDANSCQITLPVTVGLATSWYNSAWQYRKPIEISNTNGVTLTDFQVKVTLDNTFDFAKAATGGNDIRFTASNGTGIPYWIESWDNTSEQATIWVRVPSIAVSGTTIYMYYGNSLASNESNGTATFKFFDGFDVGSPAVGFWSGFTAHDWKYSMHMQEGALYYAINRAQNGWATESLDPEIEAEFDFMHSQINGDGTVVGLSDEPIYCYGLVLSNLALGYSYFRVSDPVLAQRCYDDMVLVYGYMRNTYGTPTTAPDYSLALKGFAEACKAFTTYGNTTSADESRAIVIAYVTAFTQSGGGWVGQGAVQDELKRDLGVLLAYDVTLDATYLTRVRNNIEWLLINRWVPANGGLTWTSPYVEGQSYEFYECHQQWFMTAVKMLYDRNNTYNYLPQGLAAWRFLTDNNYAGIDMYVHNHVTHSNNAFFSYRQLFTDGSFQTASFKGSYEIGTALWGMSLNYSWLSSYQSTHSSQAYNYLDEMVKQIKKLPANTGFFSADGNWIRLLSWTPSSWEPDGALWTKVGSPTANLVNDNGNNVLSLRGSGHDNLYTTVNQTFDNFIFEARVNMTSDLNSTCTPEIGFHYTDLTHRYFTMMRGETQNDLFIRRIEGVGYRDNVVPYNYTGGIYYNYKMAVNGNEIKLYLNDALEMDYTDNGTILTGGFSLANYDGTAVYYDDIRVREYAAVEPLTNVGIEQAGFGWIGCDDDSWANGNNWNTGIAPDLNSNVTIYGANNYPKITDTYACNTLTIEPSARLTIESGGSLTAGSIIINSSGTSSSGSLINYGTLAGPVTYNRLLRSGTNYGDRHLFSSPVGGQSVSGFRSTYEDKIDNIRIWNEEGGIWAEVSSDNFESGKGYNIYQTDISDGIFSFTGSLVAAAQFIASSPYSTDYGSTPLVTPGSYEDYDARWVNGSSRTLYAGGGWNLLGNPFTSVLQIGDPNGFLNANDGDGITFATNKFDPNYVAVYLYDGISGRYYYRGRDVDFSDPTDGENPANLMFGYDNIQAGQGFFVLAMKDGVIFDFDRSMQTHSTITTMLKSTKTEGSWPGIKLKIKYGNKENSTLVVYNENMTVGLDPGYDVGQFTTVPEVEIYTSLVEKGNSVNFTRQALPLAGVDKNIIPVGIDSEKGGEVTFSAYTVPIGSYKFWLEDRKTGIITDLSTKSYTVTIPGKTYGTGRFFIIASINTPTDIDKLHSEDTGVRIWTSNDKLLIKGEVSDNTLCEVYDMRGQRVLVTNLNDKEMNTIDLPSGLSGVYLIRVTDGAKVTTAKVALL